MQHKAVVLGTNYYIGLSTIRCLGSEGIHTVAADYSDAGTYGATSKYCSEQLILPHYKKDTEHFINTLIAYATQQEHKPVLIPCHDSYLEVIDAHLDTLKQHYLLPNMDQGLYTKVMDKEKLHQLAVEEGVRVPETVYLNDESFTEKVEQTIQFPCLVKPVDSPTFVSVFRQKLFKVYDMEELNDAIKKAKDAELEVIIQRIIPGADDHMHTFDAYLNHNSKITHWTTCQKFRQYPINFGASVFTVQKHIPELYDLGAHFLENIGYKGFAEIEFKKDETTGEFYLIEINARITNFNHMLYDIGLNFPYIMYRELIGEPLEPKAVTQTTNRAFWYAQEDLLAIKEYIKTGQLSVKEVSKSFFRPKTGAVWNRHDPKPAWVYSRQLVRKALKRVTRRS
ncbi:D-aspartate ligase [Lentibacillus sp. JNUCC-1]|uniref:carboxylate--amine ligase n=1 Tax=Lentibacillus sp. JNUCC-1 TaxID=2654513 RepID=UPI0012E766B1|nr:carboxylate--amine ligase [Lentibacillus sp. JNUCC-1]MUV39299.1 D-aspartate ligase [Lentibacillus sp. JNUCC-1]